MAMESITKKWKIAEEKRKFNIQWTEKYFVSVLFGNIICLLCNDKISVCKEYNIKRHYASKHESEYQTFNEERRKTKIEELTKAIRSQQASLQKHVVKTGTCTKVSYLIAEKLAKKGKPLVDGELIKECIVIAFNEYCPDKVNLVKETCLSHQTIGRRIDDLGDNIEGTLKDKLSACVLYSLALDESTDQSDTAQLVIFIRGIDINFNIIEEMLDLCHIKGTTTGKDIYEFVNLSLDKFSIDRKNIYSITTDGAPALTGKHNGFITLFKESVDHEILSYHCLIHQQQLCAQKLNMKHLMTDLVKAVNFIRSRVLNHREFKAFLDEVGSEYEDVVYFSKVR
ncbi:general transcription factor II-I repeat domain-containing protein 2A-like [Macrobrachium rosenbergii]|uniref:general transcription factor II-I repeat domain-containing protein 2A-like n=1 Tax=Macrobrachium rosenbergii TaxID=79674 RepID=UPI0034D42EAB